MTQSDENDLSLRLPFGHEEIEVRNRYETLSIANDVLIALFFVAGSIFFFFTALETAALWMFLLGSIQFLLRPAIRLRRRIHLRRLGNTPSDSSQDY
jgi:YrhK-like protein